MAHLGHFVLQDRHLFFKVINLIFHDRGLAFVGAFGKGGNAVIGASDLTVAAILVGSNSLAP